MYKMAVCFKGFAAFLLNYLRNHLHTKNPDILFLGMNFFLFLSSSHTQYINHTLGTVSLKNVNAKILWQVSKLFSQTHTVV